MSKLKNKLKKQKTKHLLKRSDLAIKISHETYRADIAEHKLASLMEEFNTFKAKVMHSAMKIPVNAGASCLDVSEEIPITIEPLAEPIGA